MQSTRAMSQGRRAYNRPERIDSRAAENTIVVGQAVKRGTLKGTQVKAWDGASAADLLEGFAVYSEHVYADVHTEVTVPESYLQYRPVPVMRQGALYTKVSDNGQAVVPGDRVCVLPDGFVTKSPMVLSAVYPTITLEPAGANNDVKVTALQLGLGTLKVALLDPSGNDQALKVVLEGDTINVYLATGPAGAITSTAAEVIAAINAAIDVNDLVVAANGTGSNGTAVVTAIAATPLAGEDTGSGTFGVEIANSEFKSAGNPGDVVIIEFDLPSLLSVKEV